MIIEEVRLIEKRGGKVGNVEKPWIVKEPATAARGSAGNAYSALALSSLPIERVDIESALGRYLARTPCRAPHAPTDRSFRDGTVYAVVAGDMGGPWPV
jgi:hypothetical protein